MVRCQPIQSEQLPALLASTTADHGKRLQLAAALVAPSSDGGEPVLRPSNVLQRRVTRLDVACSQNV